MILNGRLLTFEQECFLKEVNMRGACMTMSADMEALLLKIILYCIVDDPNATIRQFEGMMLGAKLQMAKGDLRKYHPKVFTKHSAEFKQMEKFTKLRGKLAHCQIMWDENGKDSSWFYYIDIKKIKGEYRIIRPKLSVEYVGKKMDAFKKSIFNMAEVAQKMITEFNLKYPNFDSSSQA
jgi:hypothetical protein